MLLMRLVFAMHGLYFTTAEIFNAQTAKDMGLCHEVVLPGADLAQKAEKLIKQILQQWPHAHSNLGPFMESFQPIPITPEVINHTAEMIAALRISNEGQEGLTAFLEKPPHWRKNVIESNSYRT